MLRFKPVLSGVFSLCVLVASTLDAQVIEWKTYTSIGIINDIATDELQGWAATNGGVLSFPVSENGNESEVVKFTNTDGLSGNDVVAVEIDNKNEAVWFALTGGELNRFFPEDNRWEYVEEYTGQQIQDFVIFGDSIYVALDIGVSLYLTDKREVKETYRNLGLSGSNSVTEITANHIFIKETDIWVSTDKGLAQSSLLLANLQAPASWQAFTTESGLGNDFVNETLISDDIAYAATRSGIFKFVSGAWQSDNLNGDILELELVSSNSLFVNKTVIALASDGVHWYDENTSTWPLLGGSLSNINTISTDPYGNIWIGREDVGLGKYNYDTEEWEFLPNNGPARNSFDALDVDSQGRLWVATRGAANGGIQMFDNDTWTYLSRQDGLPSNDFRTILVDADDNVWAGSWGGGLVRIDNDFNIAIYDSTDGILAGFRSQDPHFVLVPHLVKDNANNLWILNREAVNGRVVAVFTSQEDIIYFSTTRGIRSKYLNVGLVDRVGRIWLGTEDRGVNVLDLNDTLEDLSDDDYNQGLTFNSGEIFSNNITALAEDQDGTIWIGTDAGLNFWFGGNTGEEFDTPVNAIGIDGVGNKWIGTDNGVTILRGHFDSVGDLTTGNSQLVADKVIAFDFDYESGIVWIGTDQGLSQGKTLFTAPKDNLKLLSGYPNPYFIDSSDTRFTITNLVSNSLIRIFDSSGRLIRELDKELDVVGAQAFWDGTNDDGDIVASGIYVYLAYTENNLSGTGKVAVIRR